MPFGEGLYRQSEINFDKSYEYVMSLKVIQGERGIFLGETRSFTRGCVPKIC